jgi:hypothetical protein
MTDKLTSLCTSHGESKSVYGTVKTTLKYSEHLLTGSALHGRRVSIVFAELLLEDAVNSAGLLLLTETQTIFTNFCPALTMLARWVGTTRYSTLFAVAALTL